MRERIPNLYFLGQAIKAVRKEKKLTQAELGEQVKVRQSTISAIENGGSDVQIETLFKIFAGLDLDMFVISKELAASTSFPPEANLANDRDQW